MKRIIRVFPRRTKATPTDELVRVACPPGFFDEADEVHISVTFTWDLPFAEELAKMWQDVATVKIGGPATGEAGGDFAPGMYLKKGYVVTSRGCPNRCWHCTVWRREGDVRELPITDGWNVQDDNLLACSEEHQRAVFAMLARQTEPIQFAGGLEATRLKPWHCEVLRALKSKQIFFAYDTPDDLEPLRAAGQMLVEAGFRAFRNSGRALRAYVLCGYPKDTFEKAEKRMDETIDAGFMPMAMLYRDKYGLVDIQWRRWIRPWARPAIMAAKIKTKPDNLKQIEVGNQAGLPAERGER